MQVPAFIPFELPEPALAEAARHDLRLGWRAVHPDLRSRDGFRYPFPGQWADAGGPILDHNDTCPRAAGDGLCAAKTWDGAASGGIPASTVLLVGYHNADVYGEDDQKVRVGAMLVLDVVDIPGAIRRGWFRGADLMYADLMDADLRGADLRGAYLMGADLMGANLMDANLRGAYLGGAYLMGADLRGANLMYADLMYADLMDANLRGANLRGAYLGGAYLGGADLRGADLMDADLRGADLRGAVASRTTIWPTGFDSSAHGVVAR